MYEIAEDNKTASLFHNGNIKVETEGLEDRQVGLT